MKLPSDEHAPFCVIVYIFRERALMKREKKLENKTKKDFFGYNFDTRKADLAVHCNHF